MKGARPLSSTEIHAVLRACSDERERGLFVVGINLGLRIGELVGLKWSDVWERGRVLPMVYLERTTTKNNKARAIPVNERVVREIKRLRKSTGTGMFLFPGRHEGHMSVRHANRVLGDVFERAGLGGRLSSHTLRKSFGSLLAEGGTGIHVIQELLGHSSIATTRVYLGVGIKNMREAVRGLSKAY